LSEIYHGLRGSANHLLTRLKVSLERWFEARAQIRFGDGNSHC